MKTSKLLKLIFANKKFNRYTQKTILRIDNLLYRLLSILVVIENNGNHPKHKILKYRDWYFNEVKKDSKVLDLGCGNGNLSYLVSKKVEKVVAIDIENKNIAYAKKKHKRNNIEYLVGDATKIKFKENFDFLILSNVLEHIDKRIEFLKSIKNLSKIFLIRVPLIERDWVTIHKKKLGVEHRLDNTHFIEYTQKEFEYEIKSAGLKIKNMQISFGEILAVIEK